MPPVSINQLQTNTSNSVSSETEQTRYGLPSNVKFCSRCVMSNQRPGSVVERKHTAQNKKPTIAFDENGVCSACRFADIKKKIDWAERENELKDLLNRHRRSDGSYDCIVPGSGGKDSCYVSHILKYKYGMNPLTVTWAPHAYTDIGFRNLERWIHSGFDNILVTPNGSVHRLLTKLSFENLLHPFQPFIIGQRTIAPKMSALYQIPLVIYGENAAEYGDDLDAANCPTMKEEFFSGDRDLNKLVFGGVPATELISRHKIAIQDLNPYFPADLEALRKIRTEVHHFSYYYNWDPQENYYYAIQNTGFEPNTERTEGTYSKYGSIDDKIDNFHYYTTLIKFGIGRTTYDAAQEIRTGKITREEGVTLVRRFDTEFPKRYFKDFLNYVSLTEDRFEEIIDQFRSQHLWIKSNDGWHLKFQVS